MIIRAADNYLISKLEKVTHWVQRWTGKTNHWLASRFMLVITYILLAEIMFYFLHGKAPIWLGFHAFAKYDLYFSFIFIPLFLSDVVWGYKFKEQRSFERLSKGLANPSKARILDIAIRVIFLFFLMLAFFVKFYDIYLLSLTIASYLDACDPLPPCEAKIKELFRSARLVLVRQPTN